jgi:stage IV sporulation protein FB
VTTSSISSKGISFRLLGFPVLYRWSALALPVYFFFILRTGVSGPLDAVAVFAGLVVGIGAAILVHELGHALTARHYGGVAQIEIFLLGGLTQHAYDRPLGNNGKILVSAAGTLAGLAVGLPILLLFRFDLPSGGPWTIGLNLFVIASVVWGVFNLLPLPGLDGSHILDAVVRRVWPARAGVVVPVITSVTAVVAIIGIYVWQGPFAALWLVLIFGPELFSVGDRIRSGRDEPLLERGVEAEDAYRSGDFDRAASIAEALATRATSDQVRSTMRRIQLMALMQAGRYSEVLEMERAGARLPTLARAQSLTAVGRFAEAEAALRSAPPTADIEVQLAEVLVLQDLDRRVPEILGPEGAARLVDRALELEPVAPDRGRRLAAIVRDLGSALPVDRARASVVTGASPDTSGLAEADRWLVEGEMAARRGTIPEVSEVPAQVARTLQDRLQQSGHARAAVEVARRMGDRLDASGQVVLARSLSRMNDPDAAFAALDAAVELGFGDVPGLASDPELVGLRSDPRWRRLLDRMATGRDTR